MADKTSNFINPENPTLSFSKQRCKPPETAPAIRDTALAIAVGFAVMDMTENNWQTDAGADAGFTFIA